MSPTSLTIPLTISHFAPRPLRRLRGQSMPKCPPLSVIVFSLPAVSDLKGCKLHRDPQSRTTATIGIRMHFLPPFRCRGNGSRSEFCALKFLYMAGIPQCLLVDLETGYLPSVTVPCHWFAPGGCAISIPCPCSTFREDDDATPPCAAALPHSLSISCNATAWVIPQWEGVHQRRRNRSCLANLIAIKQDSTFQISF